SGRAALGVPCLRRAHHSTTAERIAAETTRNGSVVGLHLAETADEDDAAPWTRTPSGRPRNVRITQALPARVSAVLSQRLFVEKVGLPSPLLDQIKRLALPEPRVLQEAEHAPVHRDDTARDQLRTGFAAT